MIINKKKLLENNKYSGVARAPQAPRPRGGPRGWRGPPGARQEEVVAVTPWPGAQTRCLRGGPKIVATPLNK